MAVLVLCALIVASGPGGGAPAQAAPSPAPAAAGAVSVRWGFYVTYNPNSLDSLRAHVDQLNYVSPWFYSVNGNGDVTNTVQPDVNALLAQHGVHNLPMLKNLSTQANFHDALANPIKRGQIITAMLSAVQANNYDGITVDFEGITPEDGPFLTLFMRELYGNMKAINKLVAMAVPAKTRDINTGWAGAFTYRDLAPWTDFMILMAYDQHFPGGQPGPIAPIGWMGDVVRYSQQRIDPKKIILGIGLYGYDWNTTTRAQADPRTWNEVQTLAATFRGQFGWSTVDASGFMRYTAGGQQHEVWYENRQSFDAKLALVRANPIAGFALWRLGQEDPGVWQSVLAIRSPCDTVAPFASTRFIWYIRETGHSLQGAFLTYWNAHGGASIFGYPLTEEFQEANPIDGRVYTVQYFERQRFEYHPENRGTPFEVQLGLLGVQIIENRFFPLGASVVNSGTTTYFPQTGHTLGGGFRTFWLQRGGLSIFGYPLTEEFLERNPDDGNYYTVQYFERARFEWHPELRGTPFEFQLGLLGRTVLARRGCEP
jgi:spore germination protein YaaH